MELTLVPFTRVHVRIRNGGGLHVNHGDLNTEGLKKESERTVLGILTGGQVTTIGSGLGEGSVSYHGSDVNSEGVVPQILVHGLIFIPEIVDNFRVQAGNIEHRLQVGRVLGDGVGHWVEAVGQEDVLRRRGGLGGDQWAH